MTNRQAKTKLVVRETLECFRPRLLEAALALRECLVPITALPLTTLPSLPPPQWYTSSPHTRGASLSNGVPPYASPSSLLTRAASDKCREREEMLKARRCTRLCGLSDAESASAPTKLDRKRTLALVELAKTDRQQQTAQEETWLPALSACEKNAHSALRQVPVVQQHVQHWYAYRM